MYRACDDLFTRICMGKYIDMYNWHRHIFIKHTYVIYTHICFYLSLSSRKHTRTYTALLTLYNECKTNKQRSKQKDHSDPRYRFPSPSQSQHNSMCAAGPSDGWLTARCD